MPPATPMVDPLPLARLIDEFRSSMRRLLRDLCKELKADYSALASRFNLPVGLLLELSRSLQFETYSGWKLVGWIESLNDLVYFLDLLQQWEAEQDRSEFAGQLFTECEEKFFENSYLADLFPSGRPIVSGFEARLKRLCRRLAREVTQESLFLDPWRTVKWARRQGPAGWRVKGTLAADFERADLPGTIPVGCDGAWCEAPATLRQRLKRSSGCATFLVQADGIAVQAGRITIPLWTCEGGKGKWLWKTRSAPKVIETPHGPVTVGPTLRYGRDRYPSEVCRTTRQQVEKIRRAWRTIAAAWPEGYTILERLTSRIVPLQAQGVVSFSYRHRPGLSFINCFDRDALDLIDDLIHETSHHLLNLLLRKHVMYHGDRNQQIFYSPWRRSLRPLRGILHATFTFTIGAMLFERLSRWGSGEGGVIRWREAGLTGTDLQRAKFRCLEEVHSVRYSLRDLQYADRRLGWLTDPGRRLVGQMEEAIDRVEHEIDRFKPDVLRSKFGPEFRRHVEHLKHARQTYGPMRLTEA